MGISRNGFQNSVNSQPAPAAAGDFAGTNPRMSLSAPVSGYVAIPDGVVVGRFAWGSYALATVANYFSLLASLGFVKREQQAIIIPFLDYYALEVIQGLPVTLFSRGDFWAQFASGAAVGQKVYADPLTGECSAAATGLSLTTTLTASLATTGVLTVSAVGAATLAAGQVVTGTGVPAGTYIVSQLTGSAGDTGTYQLSVTGTTLGSRAMVSYGVIETSWTVQSPALVDVAFTADLAVTGVLTVSAISAGVLSKGQFISGTGVPSGTVIVNQLTGTAGSTGTYTVNRIGTLLTSRAMSAMAGKLAKISNWV